jgi:hypothetical protein
MGAAERALVAAAGAAAEVLGGGSAAEELLGRLGGGLALPPQRARPVLRLIARLLRENPGLPGWVRALAPPAEGGP